MANAQNLKPFKIGYDARRGSKPIGSKHISTYIREMMEDDAFEYTLANGDKVAGAPMKAILTGLILKAVEGDLKAIDLLAKYGYGQKTTISVDHPPSIGLTSAQAEQLLRLRAARGDH